MLNKLLLIVFLIIPFLAKSQYLLEIKQCYNCNSSKVSFQSNHPTTEGVFSEIQKIQNQFVAQGFLDCSVSFEKTNDSLYSCSIEQNQLVKLRVSFSDSVSRINAQQFGVKQTGWQYKAASAKNINKCRKEVITKAENNGFPFASVVYDTIERSNKELHLSMVFKKNNLIVIDTLEFRPTNLINQRTLEAYLRVKKGKVYNESVLKKTEARLRDLPFLDPIGPTEVFFTFSKAKVRTSLSPVKSNIFDLVIGFLPNASDNGTLQIVGQGELVLQNSFKQADVFSLEFNKTESLNQQFESNFSLPYVFGSDIGTMFGIKLRKQDTSFLNVSRKIALSYKPTSKQTYAFQYELFTTNVFSSQQIIASLSNGELSLVSQKTNKYKIAWEYKDLDRRINPKKGSELYLNTSLGQREIQQNPNLDDSIYKNINISSVVFNIGFGAAKYLPITSKSTIKLAIYGESLLAKQLFENEQLRIGGFKSVQGFDEQTVLATSFGVGEFKYFYFLSENSSLNAIVNAALVKNELMSEFYSPLYGVGPGLNLGTKSGKFSISYVVGWTKSTIPNLQNGKLHFGLVNNF
jgi:hypothetical protein